ncbi:mediator of RNA polymerase II transcription subunit 25 [Trichonephila inaurata madagascariensis]|uniref:Mediator of RNA polymerase II transcription subunit 25 n=1 Tax=Trichonephila inaurata madagascariensis TaxID=2747483 RepID=A0A8X6J5S5_9ARAC|nr:mediator of RNA polymerase II transcription subunit 25 [Trichonephila inaurata madagascariensis]
MVVADQSTWLSDVVFVIEGTANMSPYIENLKSNYILPTLECFNGSPADDRDCGSDTNCTMYALVVFLAADCAPETASVCYAPTASTHKFLSQLDKVKFINGGGEEKSHISEGLSTALQVFDDFQTFRENGVQTQKHCILICNSPPYDYPALESSVYYGLCVDQLAALMAERQINFSLLSPRRIPILSRIYEKAGGDLQHALGKNYAKDRRHLVLLKGFQLQERPKTPPSLDSKSAIPVSSSVCSPPASTGQKRPATSSPPHPREATAFKQPATQSNYNGLEWPSNENPVGNLPTQNQVPSSIQAPTAVQSAMSYGQNSLPGQPNQPLPQRPGIQTPPSHLNSLNQPNPPNVTITNKGPPQHTDGIRPQRGHSPVPSCGPRMSWNQPGAPSSPASTPPTTSVLATQLNMAPSNMPMRHNNPQMQGAPNVSNIVSQAQSTINPTSNVLNTGRGNLPNINLRISSTSPGPSPIQNSNPMGVPINQHQAFGQTSQQQANTMAGTMSSSIQSKLGNATSGNQMIPNQGQTMTTAAPSNLPLQAVSGILPISQSTSQQSQPSNNPSGATKDRRTIWQGILEFQQKSNSLQSQGQRVTHSLPCTMSSVVTGNGESDVNAEKWPNRLVLQLIPKHLIVVANLFSTLKTAARHVLIHFNQESEALNKLCESMSSGLVGCIQFQNLVDIRIMMVLYMPDKCIYMGFIANDQESFFNNIRQRYENHRKQQQQQQKQRMQAGNIPVTDSRAIQPANPSNPNMIVPQSATNTLSQSTNNQLNSCMPINQQVPQINPPPPQPQVHSSNTNNQANAARLSQLEAARQQNLLNMQQLQQTLEAAQQKELQYKAAQELHQQQLMQNANRFNNPLKIQQLQQTLEAAQQKELQYKAAQEQQKQQQQQQQQQQMIERQNAIRHLQQQLQHQQQQLAQQQQSIQMQQVSQQQSSHNPQLRNLLQQQVQQQMRRQQQQQQHQMLMQHPQGMRPQLSGNIPQGGIGSSVGQPQQQQPQTQQQNQQQSWGDLGILDSLPP